ncbi:MAG: DNA-deoxyinosine glycosylase [Thermodesulfobacteriota bacterium]
MSNILKFKKGFPPIAEKTATVLILGTMPGEESLKQNEYYAYPRNSFWKIMATLFGFDSSATYEQKTQVLLQNKIALWDVISSCQREGSLDSSIKNETIIENDFNAFFKRNSHITHVFFNGARAENEYRKKILPKLSKTKHDIKYARLPSTSPAMAQLSLNAKILEWSKIKRTR